MIRNEAKAKTKLRNSLDQTVTFSLFLSFFFPFSVLFLSSFSLFLSSSCLLAFPLASFALPCPLPHSNIPPKPKRLNHRSDVASILGGGGTSELWRSGLEGEAPAGFATIL